MPTGGGLGLGSLCLLADVESVEKEEWRARRRCGPRPLGLSPSRRQGCVALRPFLGHVATHAVVC